jgi:hypothetical protein
VALTSNESTTALTGHVDETDDDPVVSRNQAVAYWHDPRERVQSL